MDKVPEYDIDQLIASGDFDSLDAKQQAFVLETLGSKEAFEILRETLGDLGANEMPTNEATKTNVMDAFDRFLSEEKKVLAPLPSKNPRRLKIAAAIIILLGGAFYFTSLFQEDKNSQLAENKSLKKKELPKFEEPKTSESTTLENMDTETEAEPAIETANKKQEKESANVSEVSPSIGAVQSIEMDEEFTEKEADEPAELIIASRPEEEPEENLADIQVDNEEINRADRGKSFSSNDEMSNAASRVNNKINAEKAESSLAMNEDLAKSDFSSAQSLDEVSLEQVSKKKSKSSAAVLFKIVMPKEDHYTAY